MHDMAGVSCAVVFNAIDADESGTVNEVSPNAALLPVAIVLMRNGQLTMMQEEYRALVAMMATGADSAFPGSFKAMLDVVDRCGS